MRMSTCNQLPGTVTAVEHGGVMSTVTVLVKATEVMLGVEPLDPRVLPALLRGAGWTSLRIDDDSDRYLAVAQRST